MLRHKIPNIDIINKLLIESIILKIKINIKSYRNDKLRDILS